jgi:hypothetical protein
MSQTSKRKKAHRFHKLDRKNLRKSENSVSQKSTTSFLSAFNFSLYPNPQNGKKPTDFTNYAAKICVNPKNLRAKNLPHQSSAPINFGCPKPENSKKPADFTDHAEKNLSKSE